MEWDSLLAQLILEHLDTVAVTDAEGRYIYVNKGWTQWMGMQPEEVLGKYVRDVVPNTKIDLALKTGKPLIGQILFEKRSGNEKQPNIVTYYPIKKEGKVIAGFVFSIFKDFDTALDFGQRLGHLTEELNYYKDELRKLRGARYGIESIIGSSPSMSKIRDQIIQAARSNSTVLIDGETGTGKELVAHAIHNCGPRSAFNFVKVNCAAIPNELLEAELFGYEEGAFTGAVKGGRRGKFELAHMGSLFLDEVNQLPLTLQPKLLRVLQEKEVERLGGKKSIEINVRIISAANVPLEKMVKGLEFRSDLFYRLNIMRITLPPLRERKEDIPQLIQALLNKLNYQLGVEVKSVASAVEKLLIKYDWPGNVRELQNVLERAMNVAWGDTLEAKHFEWFIDNSYSRDNPVVFNGESVSLRGVKHSVEKEVIIETLKRCGGNRVLAARELQISRSMLYRKLRKFGIRVST